VPLNAGLERSLASYAAAAAAGCASVLWVAPPAEAEIVYTPTNTPIPINGGPVPLDLNHDGMVDFSFTNVSGNWSGAVFNFLLAAIPKQPSNAIWGRGSRSFTVWRSRYTEFGGGFAGALQAGFKVGPDNLYLQRGKNGIMGFYRQSASSSHSNTATYGQWWNTKSRYLGLQFVIDGEEHYGWARLEVGTTKQGGVPATLTGYAYETIPNKPIIVGKTKGPDDRQGSLGALAAGSAGRP